MLRAGMLLFGVGLPRNVFAEEDKLFCFGSHMVGQEVSERFKLTNPFKVICNLTPSPDRAHPQSSPSLAPIPLTLSHQPVALTCIRTLTFNLTPLSPSSHSFQGALLRQPLRRAAAFQGEGGGRQGRAGAGGRAGDPLRSGAQEMPDTAARAPLRNGLLHAAGEPPARTHRRIRWRRGMGRWGGWR